MRLPPSHRKSSKLAKGICALVPLFTRLQYTHLGTIHSAPIPTILAPFAHHGDAHLRTIPAIIAWVSKHTEGATVTPAGTEHPRVGHSLLWLRARQRQLPGSFHAPAI